MDIKNVLIFLLEIFLTALVNAPKRSTFSNTPYLIQRKWDGKQSILASFHSDGGLGFQTVPLLPSPRFGRNVPQEQWIIKPFSRILPNSSPNLRFLQTLRQRLRDRFITPVLIGLAKKSLMFAERCRCLPVRALSNIYSDG
jgi:hypothetical protein